MGHSIISVTKFKNVLHCTKVRKAFKPFTQESCTDESLSSYPLRSKFIIVSSKMLLSSSMGVPRRAGGDCLV